MPQSSSARVETACNRARPTLGLWRPYSCEFDASVDHPWLIYGLRRLAPSRYGTNHRGKSGPTSLSWPSLRRTESYAAYDMCGVACVADAFGARLEECTRSHRHTPDLPYNPLMRHGFDAGKRCEDQGISDEQPSKRPYPRGVERGYGAKTPSASISPPYGLVIENRVRWTVRSSASLPSSMKPRVCSRCTRRRIDPHRPACRVPPEA